MKRTLTYFLFTACLLFAARTAVHAQTEKAIFCSSNKTLYFVYDNATYTKGGSFTPEGTTIALTITEVYTGFKNKAYYYYGRDKQGPWYANYSSITTINFQSSFSNCKSSTYSYWFTGMRNVTTLVNAKNLNTSEAKNLSGMFYSCSNLQYGLTELSYWDTSNVTNLDYMFESCRKLTNISALASWNVSNVITMDGLFVYCNSLVDISPLSGWNVSNVKTARYIFEDLTDLVDISPLSGWNVSNFTTMERLFHNCNLNDLSPLSSWDVSKATSMYQMFADNTDIVSLEPIKNWKMTSVTTMYEMFKGCSGITDEGFSHLSGWGDPDGTNGNLKNLTNMYSTFKGLSQITNLDALADWNVAAVTNLRSTFYGCTSLTNIDALADWNPMAVKDLNSTFNSCTSLTNIDALANWHNKVGNVTDMGAFLWRCSSLENVDGLSDWDVSNVTTLAGTFRFCDNLTNIDALETWKDKVGNVTTIDGMFYGSYNLTDINALKDWALSGKLVSMDCAFFRCFNLKSADLSGWNTTNVKKMRELFSGCVNMTKVKFGPGFSVSNLQVATSENTSLITESSGDAMMFSNCHRLRYIDFHDCYNGTTANRVVPLQSNTGVKPTFVKMFSGCPATTVIYLPKYSGSTFTNKQNVVYSVVSGSTEYQRCNNYYSEDKTSFLGLFRDGGTALSAYTTDMPAYPGETLYNEVELPYSFLTKKAEYSRTMPSGSKYGTAILPYDFTENSDTRCFVLVEEHPEKMYFVEATSIPAHTPFLYEKLNGSTTASFVVDHNSSINITVNATRDTSVPTPDSEHMPTGKTEADYGPYLGSHTIPATPKAGGTPIAENLVWQTKGYYETAVLEPDANTFYISQNKFWQAQNMTSADGKLTVYPHRATYHGNWEYAYTDPADPNSARSFSIFTLDSEDEGTVTRLIEAGRIVQAEHEATAIYDMQGRQQQHIVKGMNIIRTSDGKIKKVIKK